MQLYDSMIQRVRGLLRGLPVRIYEYDEEKIWPENADFQMIFQKDVAYELGAGKATSANLTCVTDHPELFRGAQEWMEAKAQGSPEKGRQIEMQGSPEEGGSARDQILVYGQDLQEIQGDVSYARICEVLVRSGEGTLPIMVKQGAEAFDGSVDGSLDSGRMLKLLQDIDFVKFHVYGKGFMMRTSGQSAKEQIRVSKKALREGISFERMGNTLISHYKKNPSVLAARVIFVTTEEFDYVSLQEEAGKAVEIRNSLSKIQKGLPTECSICEIRDICSEVEGLRELHFGKKEKAGKNPADSKKLIF